MSTELTAAYAAVPEIAAAETRLTEAKRLVTEAPEAVAPEAAREAVIAEAVAAFVDSGTFPADVGRRAEEAFRDAEATGQEIVARKRAVTGAEWALYSALTDHAGAVLSHLAGRLADLLESAREAFAALGGVNSAEDAIAAGDEATSAWATLRTVVRDVGSVRDAQWTVLRGPRAPGGGVSDWAGRQWRRKGFGHVKSQHPDEMPDDVRSAAVDGSATLEYVRWLLDSGSAYVPLSLEELAADVADLTPVDVGPVTDLSPMELPPEKPRAGAVYPHSMAPHMDYATPRPPEPTPNATVNDVGVSGFSESPAQRRKYSY
ncbi:hypothetical protein ACFY1C_20025 [Streptomyces sp. NPDC001279]|uniref:hypothetical protein n=1 Tax=Streptomyces sp. NPDC001279 TaxID=3364556 RepID=UPI0036C1C016